MGRKYATETAARIHRNLGSLPARLPAQLRYHACLLSHNAVPTRARTRSFSRGGLAEWRSPNLACVLCGGGTEDLAHLHTQCPVTGAAVVMITQHSPRTRDFVTGAKPDCFLFRSELAPDALLHLLCLSRAVWEARKARATTTRTTDLKVWWREGATAIVDSFLQLLQDSTKAKRDRRDRVAERAKFLQTLEHVEDTAIIYYTDGSSFGNPGPSGAGFACYSEGSLVDSAAFSLGETSNNVAELHGLREALADALSRPDPQGRCPPRHLYLFVDNQYPLNVSIGKWQAKAHRPLIAKIHELIAALRQTTNLTIGWVPGHANVDGNEQADMLAKQGARACLPAPAATPPPTRQRSQDPTHPASPRPERSPHAEEVPSPPPARYSLRCRPQPRRLAPDIDFSFFHSPKPRAPQSKECEHGVAYRLDRLTTGPPCLLCITLSPRDASLSPIRLRSPGGHSPYVPFIDFDFE